MVRLFDHYVVGKLIVTTTVLEVVAFVWFYGLEALANDFEFVLGYKLNIIWKSLWFLCPFVLTVSIASSTSIIYSIFQIFFADDSNDRRLKLFCR